MSSDIDYGEFTPETIDFGSMREIAQNALCVAIGDSKQLPADFFKSGRSPSVLLVINGVQFSFEELLSAYDSSYEDRLRFDAREYAEERLRGTTIERLEHVIQSGLDALLPYGDDT